jgi:hypothetical protein
MQRHPWPQSSRLAAEASSADEVVAGAASKLRLPSPQPAAALATPGLPPLIPPGRI